jgi:hypothetical protein
MSKLLNLHINIIESTINKLSATYFLEKYNPNVPLDSKNIVLSIGKQGLDFYKSFEKWYKGKILKR